MVKRKTWTNIDACCVSHLHFSHGTDLEFVAEAQAGYQKGKMIRFTDCTDCGRRFHIRTVKK